VNLRFEEPIWMWLLAVLVPMAVVGAAWFSAMSPARRLSAVLARLCLYALLIAILAGAARVQKTDHLAVVALVDISGSVRRYGGALMGRESGGSARESRCAQRGQGMVAAGDAAAWGG